MANMDVLPPHEAMTPEQKLEAAQLFRNAVSELEELCLPPGVKLESAAKPTPTPEPTSTPTPTPEPTPPPRPSASLSAEEREKLRKDLGANFNMMFKSQELCHHAPFDGKRTQSDPGARLDAIRIVDGVVNRLRDLDKTAKDFTREEFEEFTSATQIASVELWQICAPLGVDVTPELLNSMPD